MILPPGSPSGEPAAAKPDSDDPRIAQKASEFEAVMLGQVVQLMFQGLREGGPFGGGSAEAQWKDMLAQEYGRALADAGGIGLALAMEREMRTAIAGQIRDTGETPLPREQASEP
jgi:peptidoglycan hydrolase FlgJ